MGFEYSSPSLDYDKLVFSSDIPFRLSFYMGDCSMLMCFFGVYLWRICTCVWQLQVCVWFLFCIFLPVNVSVCVFCVQMGLCSWGCTPGLTFTSFPRSCFESVEWNDHVICTHTALRAAVISPAVFSFPPAKERVEMCV